MSEPRGLTPEGRDHLVDAVTLRTSLDAVRDEAYRPNPFMLDQVEVRCSIRVNGETITITRRIAAPAWQNPEVRDASVAHVRQECALEVVKRFPPKVEIRT